MLDASRAAVEQMKPCVCLPCMCAWDGCGDGEVTSMLKRLFVCMFMHVLGNFSGLVSTTRLQARREERGGRELSEATE